MQFPPQTGDSIRGTASGVGYIYTCWGNSIVNNIPIFLPKMASRRNRSKLFLKPRCCQKNEPVEVGKQCCSCLLLQRLAQKIGVVTRWKGYVPAPSDLGNCVCSSRASQLDMAPPRILISLENHFKTPGLSSQALLCPGG